MSSDTPNATWHPALMPNVAPRAEIRTPTAALEPKIPQDSSSHGQPGPEAWFEEEAQADESWLDPGAGAAHEQAAGEEPIKTQPDSESSVGQSEENSQAARPMSFARTVSHEVNWAADDNDDDSSWNLPKADTDPFKFMPPSNRTNSFPAVPELSSHAQDSTREAPGDAPSNEASNVVSPVARFMGGDVMDSPIGASDERYVEGVPLLGSEDATETEAKAGESQGDAFFEQDTAGDDDDFFNQAASNDLLPSHTGLERKSTMQVLNGLSVGNIHGPETILEAPEDDGDEEEGEATPVTQDSMAQKPHEAEGAAALDSHDHGADKAEQAKPTEDLDAKWQAAFGGDGDDEFLADEGGDKEVDPAAFFGSDDEGFLDDADEPNTTSVPKTAPVQPKEPNGRYLPPNQPQNPPPAPSNPYAPSNPLASIQPPAASPFINTGIQGATPSPFAGPPSIPPVATPYGPGAAVPRPEPKKAQSFADKAKGGYTSPYDLPMEVVKPKKRVSMQNLQRNMGTPAGLPPTAPPPRSASMYAQGPPPMPGSSTSLSPPGSSHSAQPLPASQPSPTQQKPPAPLARAKESFFEDLPIAVKPRPTSRQSNKSVPPSSQPSPYGPPGAAPLSPQMGQGQDYAPQPSGQYPPAHSTLEVSGLVAPERVNPYATLPSGQAPAPSLPPVPSTRYSPAPAAMPPQAAVPASNRYSSAPAPVLSRPPAAGYAPAAQSAPPPPMLPHQPRTSSPLAHFEMSHDRARIAPHAASGESAYADRRASSAYEPRLQRVPSLPPTREVEEEAAPMMPGAQAVPQPVLQGEYRHGQLHRPSQTPPPPAAAGLYSTVSPPKRGGVNYAPMAANPTSDFAPPPRSQTQSPGAQYGPRGPVNPMEPVPRPLSVQGATSPRASVTSSVPAYAPMQVPVSLVATHSSTKARSLSQKFNLVPPTDGRELDPLARWKGAPVICWGVGGTIVSTFPKNVPRYGISSTLPTMIRSPGEVHVKNIKDIQPLEERLAKFPGPLKGKSKKKETIAWLTAGIETLEKSLPNLSFQQNVSLEDKRAVERVLLWKVLRLLIEHDGVLEGSPAVDSAVRAVLSPELAAAAATTTGMASSYLGAPGNTMGGGQLHGAVASQAQSEPVDLAAVEEIRQHLLVGDREKAVWAAADKRLWGHAMLVANTVSPELYHKVTQEFVKKEVNYPGHGNESLAALYEVFAGNYDESVDELVPVYARAGLQLIDTSSTLPTSTDAHAGLDKWRETLGLILSNRSPNDTRAMNALGNLLSGYGRAEAAHICFVFARGQSVFGGLDDPAANFVLVGSDHRRQTEQFAKEVEPLLLSEVYEYGLSLTGGSNIATHAPHLAAYKLQHALTLAEYGYRDKALQYCETITSTMTAQTRKSPYYHIVLENAVEDLTKRLKLSPTEQSNSWLPKPSMNKMSEGMWSRFNKFVTGDENEGSGTASPAEEAGPFARVAGGTPTISRPPSASNLDMLSPSLSAYSLGGGQSMSAIAAASPPTARATSRYAPVSPQLVGAVPSPHEPYSPYVPGGRPSMERSSSEVDRRSSELLRQPPELQAILSPKYSPANGSAVAPQPPHPSAYSAAPMPSVGQPENAPYNPPAQPNTYAPMNYMPPTAAPMEQLPAAAVQSSYQPLAPPVEPTPPASGDAHLTSMENQTPSYGYEPPSMAAYEPPSMGSYEPPSAETSLHEPSQGQPAEESQSSGYAPPSYQPYSYEPPSYSPDAEPQGEGDADSGSEAKPKKSFMDDDDDDIPALKPKEKSKADKDKENEEMFRKAAEEDAKRAAAEKAAKKGGWGLGGWFGGGAASPKKDSLEGAANKPIRAKLGESNSFIYDPDQKRWINKKAGAEDAGPKLATPPPPRSAPTSSRSATSSPAPPMATAMPPAGGPPQMGRAPPPRALGGVLTSSQSMIGLRQAAAAAADAGASGPPPALGGPAVAMLRSASSTSAASVPSRPPTSMSNASSIDDLLGAAPRKGGTAKKPRKAGRYVDVMAK